MSITAEQLQMVAERLDETWDVMRVKFVLKNNPGDLLLAILRRAAQMGQTMLVELSGAKDGKHTTSFANIRNPGRGIRSCHATTALEAAILVFIQLPVSA
jgi:hypothetical protein